MKPFQQLGRRLDWLGQRSTPHYGQLLLLVVLALALWICRNRSGEADRALREAVRARGQRNGAAATVLSFLPDRILLDERVLLACAGVFAMAALLWLAQVLIPWTPWLCATAFTCLLALHWENSVKLFHHMHVVNMVLIVLALWYGFYGREIRTALAAGRFWRTPLCPRWVHALCVFYLGIVYGACGLTKLFSSGFGWVNGVSLQLWVFMFGWDRPLAGLLLSDRRLALAFQLITLTAELAALGALFSRGLRTVVGLVLIGFHLGATFLLGVNFVENLLLLALVFLPAREVVEWFVAKHLALAGKPAVVRYPDTPLGHVRAALRARLDVWGRCEPEFVPRPCARDPSGCSPPRQCMPVEEQDRR